MGTLKNLQDASLTQRKEKGIYAAFLSMVLSNAQSAAKTKLREPSDDDALTAIYAEIKAYEKVLTGDPETGTDPLPPESAIALDLTAKVALLQGLVPKMVKGDDLRRAIQEAAVAADVTISPKAIGPIMKHLIEKHGRALIDGNDVKQMIAAGV